MRKSRAIPVATIVAILTVACGTARAASVSYVLDQSDSDPLLPDGAPWLRVTIADGANGAIDFTVDLLPALTGIADTGFGLKGFAFSSQGPANILLTSNVLGLPAGWSVNLGSTAGNFGVFDVLLKANAAAPAMPRLTFSIGGVAADAVTDYVVLSRGKASEGRVDFAAVVTGLLDQDPGRKTLTKAWFGGSQPLPVVPLPGAAWLLASAVASLAGALRGRRAAASGAGLQRPA